MSVVSLPGTSALVEIEERDGKLYATHPTGAEQVAGV